MYVYSFSRRRCTTLSLEMFLNGGWKALHYFVEKGLTSNLSEGLQIYSQYNHSYTCVSFPSIKKVCDKIHNAGGKAILAHPEKVIKSRDLIEFKDAILDIITKGVDGIKCYYPSHSC